MQCSFQISASSQIRYLLDIVSPSCTLVPYSPALYPDLDMPNTPLKSSRSQS